MRPTLNRFDQILKAIYAPRLAAMLDTEGRGVAYFERLYSLPDPADGVIDVYLDDEAITRVGELRQIGSITPGNPDRVGLWQAWADDVPGAPIARSTHWDVAADALLEWPGLPAFTKALTIELAGAETDLRLDLHRQLWGC